MTIVLLAVAGGLGAGTRFILDGLLRSRLRTALPIGTMLINITGSLVLGFLTGLVMVHQASPELVKVLGVGFLGGYTTFSTASFETVRLFQTGRVGFALISGLGTLVLSVGAAISGLILAGSL
ncbi:fluoride efflux transporter CrcB [Arthrobacter antibioticus]|uniref:fluoride efflux transporter CrcB n=1 Tax=Arthrobacter sp. H35-MC1 TaxID=3046203 RepID=UPI0024B8B32B|nr:fluoride efflux transporter CrcB [Arthrobacter sp. H35-MC1]MDJ0316069.1 fluoride efflux transporter CrcB [Arthrobacter sp. H35-MC1]